MSDRRLVRVTLDFFSSLDRLLPSERTAESPSLADFQAYDLMEIVEHVANHWDELPPAYHGPSTYRQLLQTGHVVSYVSVLARLAGDGAVELVDIDLEVTGPDDPEDG